MLVIFDLDGTLFQTAHCAIETVKRLVNELDIEPISDINILSNIRKTTDEFLRSIFPKHINIDDIHDRFRELEQDEVRERGILFPNIQKVLERLKECGHVLCICSNGSIEYIELVLKSTGIRKYFDEIYSAKHYNAKSDLVEEILADKKIAVIVGDTLHDIEAGKANNIPSIAAAYGYGNADDLDRSTFTVYAAEEIIGCLAQLNVFFQITDKLIYNNKRVIGINGVDTSGKTKFTENYARFLSDIGIKNTILHIDDYHNPLEIRKRGNNENVMHYCIDNETVLLIEGEMEQRSSYIFLLCGRS